MEKFYRLLLLVQGLYFLLTGAWGLADIASFMYVTGPKTDIWLVKTVSVCIIAISLSLLAHRAVKRPVLPAFVLGAGSSAALAGIDLYYVANKVIAPVYALDGAFEIVLLLCWIFIWLRHKR